MPAWSIHQLLRYFIFLLTQITPRAMQILLSLILYIPLFHFLICPTLASTLSPRQNQYGDYSTCAQGCIQLYVDATGCPYDISGTRNACLCTDKTYLVNVMTCTFHNCGGQVLASTAQISVDNCLITYTPSVLTADQLISAGQGISSSSTGTISSSTGQCMYTLQR
jgi:hypothetical protein